MSDPNHPIFKQFTELDPSMIIIRDTPHPDWVWNQPPIMGTLTPGYAPRTPEQPYTPERNEHFIPHTGGFKVQTQPQRWHPDFPGLWDDIPGSGTTTTYHSSTSSDMAHARPYPISQSNQDRLALRMGHPEGLAGSASRSSEHQDRQICNTGNGGITGLKHHRL
ncbi:unnamed protein product [Rhizoctonia solani]|uniref:Uncharacterized protein n=1 Tax=Rhizoctonia solani TaxID=456999 RepID=A0A8H2Y2E2_9AGAM|nr:unnamed protein product [Rhizoctonia solani]